MVVGMWRARTVMVEMMVVIVEGDGGGECDGGVGDGSGRDT